MKSVQQQLDEVRKSVYEIQVEVLEGGKMPTKAHASDAGFDLYSTDDIVIYPGQVLKHPLNIRLGLPGNCWAEIASKSGLGSKGLLVFAGVVDSGYTGIPHVVMTNLKTGLDSLYLGVNGLEAQENNQPMVIKKGEKLAQLIMNPYSENFYMVQVEKIEKETERGSGGFGSSGA